LNAVRSTSGLTTVTFFCSAKINCGGSAPLLLRMKSPVTTAGAITAVSRDLPHGSSLTFWTITICSGNFLDNLSGDAAICALIFWTTEAVEQFRHRHPHRHSQRPKLSLRTMFVAPKRKPCRAFLVTSGRGRATTSTTMD